MGNENKKVKKILEIMGAIAVLAGVFMLIMNYKNSKLKENIHSEIWDIFNGDNVKISGEKFETIEDIHRANFDGGDAVPRVMYNENKYVYWNCTIDGEFVDTLNVLLEVPHINDESKKSNIYKLKNVTEKYALVAKIDNEYYLYVIAPWEPANVSEYIDYIGGSEYIDIKYIEVTLMEGETEKKSYIYGNEVAQWVWSLLLDKEHKCLGVVPCSCISSENSEYTDKHVQIDVCMYNRASGMWYSLYILPNGNIAIDDGRMYMRDFEYEIEAKELIDALQALAENYEACVVD